MLFTHFLRVQLYKLLSHVFIKLFKNILIMKVRKFTDWLIKD